MIERVSFYRVVCDGCGATMYDPDLECHDHFRFISVVESAFAACGWHRDYECLSLRQARVYCPGCWNQNEGGNTMKEETQ